MRHLETLGWRARMALPALALLSMGAASPPVSSDEATVYVIRPGDPGGGDMVGDYVFADDRLLGVTKGKTHLVAHLPAGLHTLWCQGGGAPLELVPGQIYYLVCGFFHGYSLLDAEAGKALVAETKERPAATPAEQEDKKARRRREQFPGLQKALAEEGWLPEPLPPPPVPADTSTMMQVPAYTPVELELMENVSSANAKAGQALRFRAAAPGRIGDQEWLPAGTDVVGAVVAVRAAGRGGQPGVLAIDVRAVPIAANVRLALMGQLVSTGTSRGRAALAAFAFGGLLGSSLVEGREMVYFAGERFTFWTRDAAWAPPAQALQSAIASAGGTSDGAAIVARIPTLSAASLAAHEPPPPIAVAVETSSALSAVALVKVGDWTLPEPVRAQRVVRGPDGGWVATFGGWDFLRYLLPSTRPVPVELRADTDDGGSLVAAGSVTWRASF
ncbi:MAG TPA: hypothetical protein VGS57_11945 [Thermoanaerobaculia bacterium]|jgi:hypothetical protein|nr:hypothetical protein [Thermoanaerobaculia bacterium]